MESEKVLYTPEHLRDVSDRVDEFLDSDKSLLSDSRKIFTDKADELREEGDQTARVLRSWGLFADNYLAIVNYILVYGLELNEGMPYGKSTILSLGATSELKPQSFSVKFEKKFSEGEAYGPHILWEYVDVPVGETVKINGHDGYSEAYVQRIY